MQGARFPRIPIRLLTQSRLKSQPRDQESSSRIPYLMHGDRPNLCLRKSKRQLSPSSVRPRVLSDPQKSPDFHDNTGIYAGSRDPPNVLQNSPSSRIARSQGSCNGRGGNTFPNLNPTVPRSNRAG